MSLRCLYLDIKSRKSFFLFLHNFNMILAETGTLEMDTKIQYIRMLVCGEVLRQFYLFSAEIENTETLNVDYYIKGLALYFFPVGFLSKTNSRCATE